MSLPCHGPISCRLCWAGSDAKEKGFGPPVDGQPNRFRLINDPGAWGAKDPVVLVLGMSKGNTQADAMARAAEGGSFEAVPFAKMRPRLLQSLQAVGLMRGVTNLDPRFAARERDYGWGSILRCSLTGWNKKNDRWSGASGDVIPGLKQRDGNLALKACIQQHLTSLSERTRLIVLLGNDDRYVEIVRRAFQGVFGPVTPLDAAGNQGYRIGAQTVVHIGHPSPLNGFFDSFLTGSTATPQGVKHEQAARAVALALADYPGRATL